MLLCSKTAEQSETKCIHIVVSRFGFIKSWIFELWHLKKLHIYIYIYIYAFSRRFYPKRLTIAFRLYIFISTCVPWESNPQPFAQLTQCSTTEPHRKFIFVAQSGDLAPKVENCNLGLIHIKHYCLFLHNQLLFKYAHVQKEILKKSLKT